MMFSKEQQKTWTRMMILAPFSTFFIFGMIHTDVDSLWTFPIPHFKLLRGICEMITLPSATVTIYKQANASDTWCILSFQDKTQKKALNLWLDSL